MVALLHKIEQGFEAGGWFAQLHGGGIDGSHKEFTNEFVDFSDDVAIFVIPDEDPRHLYARGMVEHRRRDDAPGGLDRGRGIVRVVYHATPSRNCKTGYRILENRR